MTNVKMTNFDNFGDLFGGARQNDRQRHAAKSGEGIRLEGAPAVLVGDDAARADQSCEI